MTLTGRELRSLAREDGTLQLSLENVAIAPPAADEVIVRVEAAPINPSDLGLLLGPADIGSLRAGGTGDRPVLTFDLPQARLAALGARIGQSLAVGNEGAGIVVATGETSRTWTASAWGCSSAQCMPIIAGSAHATWFCSPKEPLQRTAPRCS
jgi:NADPH2:quinone reductase